MNYGRIIKNVNQVILHNSLRLSFTNIWGSCSNFVGCKSFLESNSPNILAVWDKPGFDSISSNIDEVLLINPSAVFVFGDFNIHHQVWLTYSGGTARPGELCYNFFYLKWTSTDG